MAIGRVLATACWSYERDKALLLLVSLGGEMYLDGIHLNVQSINRFVETLILKFVMKPY